MTAAGQWEKYAEQAAEPLDPAAFDQTDPQHDHWAMDFRRGIAKDRALRMLATVGPLIAEDTRERMVAAAGAALERDGKQATQQPCEDTDCPIPLLHTHPWLNGAAWYLPMPAPADPPAATL